MIIVTRLRGLDKNRMDECYAIVRRLKSTSPWIKQVKELSPSDDLLDGFHRLQYAGNWNAITFKDYYVPRFLTEIATNPEAVAWLNYLYQADRNGKTIGLACFCPDESLCHRSIVAGLLSAVGCNVKTDSGYCDTRYFAMFHKIQEEKAPWMLK